MYSAKTGVLDTLGLLMGTDKASLSNNYLHVYESIFAPLRDEEFDLIEIGVFDGASLKLWETYFPKARIVGVDIQERCRQFSGGRVSVEIGSQCDAAFLEELTSRYRPLIVIDDGSHIAEHIQFTFEHLYPKLLPGGYYIVEDTYMHFGATAEKHRGNTPISFQDYFTELALSKTRQWLDMSSPGAQFRHYWFHNTEQISFAKSLIVVRKKPEAISAVEAVEIAEMFCASDPGKSPQALFGAAGVVLAANGELDRAESWMRQAIAAQPRNAQFRHRLAEILAQQQRFEEAIAAMTLATEIAPRDPLYWDRLARLYAQVGSDEMACAAMRRCIALYPNAHSYRFLSDPLLRLGKRDEAREALAHAVELASGLPMASEWQRELDQFDANRTAAG